MNLLDLFSIPRNRQGDKIALSYEHEGNTRIWSYEALYRSVERLAGGLQAWGLKKGDRVAFFLSNRPEFVIAYLAVIHAGGIMVPINLRYRRIEVQHILQDCTPRLVVTEVEQRVLLDEVGLHELGVIDLLIVEEMDKWMQESLAPSVPRVAEDDLALVMYTSGTTGRSKGAMLTHGNVLATITGLQAAWAWEPDDRLLLCLPLFHTHGLIVGMHCALASGATILLRQKFEGAKTLAELCSGNATLFFAVPTVYVRLVEELRSRAREDFSHMRLFCSGSAPLAPETFAAFQEVTGHTILERYGMTETGMNLSNLYAGARVPGSVGVPLPGVSIRIVDSQNVDVPFGEEGELLVRGSNVFSAYWNAPDKSAESFSHDSSGRQWFHTGDIARQDPDTGYISLLGRRHELIISGGFNIYPREIEEMLASFDGVTEAAVVGRKHPEWGEVPIAYIVCSIDVADDQLVEYCRGQVASFKVPREFYRVMELPRNAMGKILKHMLKPA
jgi:malonyl-CoA/methylmalonyl-CoA synthetase